MPGIRKPGLRKPGSRKAGIACVVFLALYVLSSSTAWAGQEFHLELSGAVQTPLSLSLRQLKEFPQSKFLVKESGTAAPKGLYSGVLLRDLLAQAGPQPGAQVVVLFCADGMGGRLPLDYVMEGRLLIAHKLNDQALTEQAGGPLKAVPDPLMGYKWVEMGGLKKVLLLKTTELSP